MQIVQISVIYRALLVHHDSSLTSLKKVWQKDLDCDLDDDQWDSMCPNVFIPLSCNKIIEQNYKFMHRMYLTPLRLSKMYPNSSSLCIRCKASTGSILHVFWKCRKLKRFWNAVHDLTVGNLEIPLDISPIRYLFGTDPDRTPDPISAKRIGIISYLAKKCTLLTWNHQKPPTFTFLKKKTERNTGTVLLKTRERYS